MPRLSLVVLTCNRCEEVLATLAHLVRVAPWAPMIVVDNASTDGTGDQITRRFPTVRLIRADRNLGAAGRNLGVAAATTPYVAFCDDDTRWSCGSLERAVSVMDAWPRLAVVNASIRVGDDQRPDPACKPMQDSPLGSEGLPGPRLLGFMAGASIVRVDAYRAAGGFWAPLFIGGEEELLALDMVDAGWEIAYVSSITTCHYPSAKRYSKRRQRYLARNAIWLAWLRLPVQAAWRHTRRALDQARREGQLPRVIAASLAGLPLILKHRRVVAPRVVAMWRQTREACRPGEGCGSGSCTGGGSSRGGRSMS